MTQDEVEKTQETGEKTEEEKQQPAVKPAVKKSKAAKAAAGETKASAAEEKAAEGKPEAPAAEEEAAESKAEAPVAEEKAVESKAEASAAEAKAPPKATREAQSEPKVPAKAKPRSAAIEEIMVAIKKMTVLDLADLVKALQTEFGVTAAAPVAAVAAAPVGAAEQAVEEKTEFSVILKDIGANKISVIKAVRELTTLGLKESKELVESAPKAVKEGVSKEESTTMKQKLEAAGATVEIK